MENIKNGKYGIQNTESKPIPKNNDHAKTSDN
jgi:hypothetical protein